MKINQFKTRQQIADELGISYSTLYRRVKAAQLEINGNLIGTEKERQIIEIFDHNINVIQEISKSKES